MSRKPSVSMPDELYDAVEPHTGPTFSAWMQDAARMRLRVDEVSEQFDGRLPDGWWEVAIEEYLDRRFQPAPEREAEAD